MDLLRNVQLDSFLEDRKGLDDRITEFKVGEEYDTDGFFGSYEHIEEQRHPNIMAEFLTGQFLRRIRRHGHLKELELIPLNFNEVTSGEYKFIPSSDISMKVSRNKNAKSDDPDAYEDYCSIPIAYLARRGEKSTIIITDMRTGSNLIRRKRPHRKIKAIQQLTGNKRVTLLGTYTLDTYERAAEMPDYGGGYGNALEGFVKASKMHHGLVLSITRKELEDMGYMAVQKVLR